jgi:hypothetical protein
MSTQLTAEKARVAALEQAAEASERVVAKSKADKDQVLRIAPASSCECACVNVCACRLCVCV